MFGPALKENHNVTESNIIYFDGYNFLFRMIPVTADDQAVSEDVVREHHEAQDGDNEELEVAGQKGYHKTSH